MLGEFCSKLKNSGIIIESLTSGSPDLNRIKNLQINDSDLTNIKKVIKKAPSEIKNSKTASYLFWIALIAKHINKQLTEINIFNGYQILEKCEEEIQDLKGSRFGHESTISDGSVKKSLYNVLDALKNYAGTYYNLKNTINTNVSVIKKLNYNA